MNVVEITHGDGICVTTLEPELLGQHLEFIFPLEDSTFLQLFEARKIVEAGCAALAAERVQDDSDRFRRIDIELHDRIARNAGNPMLGRFTASISRLSLASRSRTTDIRGVREQTLEDLRAIIKAIGARGLEAARQAVVEHLRHVEASLSHVSRASA